MKLKLLYKEFITIKPIILSYIYLFEYKTKKYI